MVLPIVQILFQELYILPQLILEAKYSSQLNFKSTYFNELALKLHLYKRITDSKGLKFLTLYRI